VASEEVDLSKYRPGATVAEMPIRLEAAHVAGLQTAHRNVFVLSGPGEDPAPIVAALGALPGVVVPPPANLFEHGMRLVLANYVMAMHAGYAMSSLADSETFLRAARRLADDIYDAARGSAHDAVVVDASPANAQYASAIEALYPDALLVHATEDIAAITRAPWWSHARTPTAASEPDAELPGRPIFVVGCARSGTTWLQTMLAAHPAIGGPKEETAIFAALRELVANRALDAWMTRDELVAAMRRFALRLFSHCLAIEAPNASRFLEKTPHHAMHLETIARVFPEAMVVGIYRDGRDVVRSILEVPFGTDSTSDAATGWVRATRATAEFSKEFPAYRDVRYEEATADPVAVIGDLLLWLELPPDDAVMAELAARAPARVSQHRPTRAAGTWEGLQPADVRTVYRIAGAQLVALGYITADEFRRVTRRPAYVLDRGVRGVRRMARRLMRNR
jgi:hypothetical protein